ncbi:MAG: coproporphyrinogen III oxidase [Pedobacter sp.]|uniref:coproporphyrinogen III oxidase n=1 Tax=Pedobacter sp. TaxID=1411316 RepID=UPI003397DF83
MKRTILSLAIAGSMLLAASACNSTKNVSGSSDSTVVDSSTVTTPPADTAMKDTSKTTPPDTTKTP